MKNIEILQDQLYLLLSNINKSKRLINQILLIDMKVGIRKEYENKDKISLVPKDNEENEQLFSVVDSEDIIKNALKKTKKNDIELDTSLTNRINQTKK